MSLALQRPPSPLMPHALLGGSVLTITLTTVPLSVCFPNIVERLACVGPLPPACSQQEIDLLAPLKPLPTCQALN